MSIHPTAIIHPRAEIATDIEIGPYCIIDADVRIGSGCRLYQNVYVTGWTAIASNCELHPGVIVGHAPQDTKYTGARSYCRIGRGTVLREYVIIHRGTMPDSETVVGEDCLLLGTSHVGHNCRIGNHVTIIHGGLLGGHVEVENKATIGGAAVVHQFVRIGELAMIAGNARSMHDVPPFALIDVTGRVAGLNRLGLRRAGMTRDEVEDVRNAYRQLYGSNLPFSRALAQLPEMVKTAPGQRLVAFLQQESKRGITGRSRKRPYGDAETIS